jgi:hypothetical protein
MNLRKFPSTAGEAISSSSRLILLRRAPTRKTTSQARSLRWDLVYCRSWRLSCSRRISRCGDPSCTASVVVGGSRKRAAGVTRSRWRGIISPRVHEMISSSMTGPRRSRILRSCQVILELINVRITPYSLVPNRTRSARSPVRRPGRCCEQKNGT